MIIIRNITLQSDNIDKLREKISKLIKRKDFEFEIYRKSIDARKGILFNYQVLLDLDLTDRELKNIRGAERFELKQTHIKINNPPSEVSIIGAGPAGLFCAYILSTNGVKVNIYERGEKVEERVKTIDRFIDGDKLDINSNVQFGEGGAGTFSDGKLTARSKDPRVRKVLEIFRENGAPEDILIDSKPHIGTDLLREVIINMRKEIINNGGKFHFESKMDDIMIDDDKVESISIDNKNIKSEAYVLAIGHSARDTFELLSQKIRMENKNFAVGFRIEHKKETIDNSQYNAKTKDNDGNKLPAASYNLTYNDKEYNMGAYTFCMCPGGYVLNSSSEEDKLCVNGMSYHDRDAANSNSAIIVTIGEDIYGHDLLDGMRFQREVEKKAYELGDGKVPIQRYEDYKLNQRSKDIGKIKPSVKSGYKLSNLRDIYPKEIDMMIIRAIDHMGERLKGFDDKDAILSAVESRSSSPIRMIRDEYNRSEDIDNLYVIGEGSGYSGGIVSSAVDGIKTAEIILSKNDGK